MELGNDVLYILKMLEAAGFEGYVVGGCVRDYLMGLKPHDYDITTNALPHDIKKIFSRTVDTGIKHGTVTVLGEDKSYEVTTYRVDGEYKDSRHPQRVVFVKDIEKDLSRRDFCMNSIAYNPKTGFVDPFDGRSDIKKGIIRGVREPNLRFQEDALRMLRAVRFSAQLGFEIEKNTCEAIKKNAPLIKNISSERIFAELLRLLTSRYNERAMLLCTTGLGDYCVPEITSLLRWRGDEILPVLKAASYKEETALAAVLARAEAPETALKRLKPSNRLSDRVLNLIKYYDYEITGDKYELRRLYSILGEQVFDLFKLKKAKGEPNIDEGERFLKEERRITKKELDIRGGDLAALGFKGKEIGRAIDGLLDLVLKNPNDNKREILIREAEKWRQL